MERFQGLFGIALILGLSWLASNNRKRINYRLVASGIGLQVILALLIFKVSFVQTFFSSLGKVMEKIEAFARQGAAFVYGGIVAQQPNGTIGNYVGGGFVFAFNVT